MDISLEYDVEIELDRHNSDGISVEVEGPRATYAGMVEGYGYDVDASNIDTDVITSISVREIAELVADHDISVDLLLEKIDHVCQKLPESIEEWVQFGISEGYTASQMIRGVADAMDSVPEGMSINNLKPGCV